MYYRINYIIITQIVIGLLLETSLTSQQQQYCSSSKSETQLVINPNADLFITVLLPVHESDSRGLYSCGRISRDGLTIYEAIKWTINLINQNEGIINKQRLTDSFIPGVKIGAKIFDSCEHQELAINALIKTFPMLSVHKQCLGSNDSDIKDLAVLDASSLSLNRPEVIESAIANFIPIVPLSPISSIPPNSRANIIAKILNDLEWTRVAIFNAVDESSLFLVKSLGQLAQSGVICIAAIEELPSHLSDTSMDIQLRSFTLTLQSMLNKLDNTDDNHIPILMIGDGEPIRRLVSVMSQNSKIDNHQLLFASLPSPEMVTEMETLAKHAMLFTLSPYPSLINGLNQYWSEIKRKQNSDQWFREFIDNGFDCKSNCSEAVNTWRTWQSLPAIHTIFTLSYALKNGWLDLCRGVPGVCEQLSSLKRQEFITKYLETLQFEHNIELRSPPELQNAKKTLDSRPGEIENLKISLTRIQPQNILSELIVYNGDAPKILDPKFDFKSSPCPSGGCKRCVKVRQSRIEEATIHIDGSIPGHNPDSFSTLNGDITIGLILPIHKSGGSALECSIDLNLPAIYDYEAALWMADKINENNYLLPGIRIGVDVIDTCSLPLKATQRLTHFISSDGSGGEPLAFVSAVSPNEAKPVIELLSSLNYTVISSQDISLLEIPIGLQYGIFQTSVTYEQLSQTAVEQLRYFGWTYVSVVIDNEDIISKKLNQYLLKHTKDGSICFASTEQIESSNLNSVINNLRINSRNGAKVVLLLTGSEMTTKILITYQYLIKTGAITRGEFIFVILRDPNLDSVHAFEEELLGSLIIRESLGNIKIFDDYFKNLLTNDRRNPWLEQFMSQCGGASLKCLQRTNTVNKNSAINTMQAVVALVAGFSRLRNDTCPGEEGLCVKLLSQDLKLHLSDYIQNTRSMRIDMPAVRPFASSQQEIFEFTRNGYSSRTVEVLNFKRDSQQNKNFIYRFDTVAVFNGKTLMKNPLVKYTFYDQNGLQITASEEVRSECLNPKECQKCSSKAPEFLYFESQDSLVVTASLNIHHSSAKNPLQCGLIDVMHGIQNVEAFMWAFDVINSHPEILPGVQLGAVILDTCSSHQKTARDVSNFLSNSLLSGDEQIKLPLAETVVGFIVDGDNSKVIDAVVDVTNPFEITTFAPQSRDSKYNNRFEYPQLLRLSTPNDVYADALISILVRFLWHYVSVVYESTPQMINVYQELKIKSNFLGIEFAMEEELSVNTFHGNQIISILSRIKRNIKNGSKVVILLLSSEQIRRLFKENHNLSAEHQIRIGEILWLSIDGREVFPDFADQTLGVITISQQYQPMTAFKTYFSSLSLRNNTRNPWFQQYWESLFNCRGVSCLNGSNSGHIPTNITIDRDTSLTINSLFALANGLELTRRNLCPKTPRGLCPEFTKHMKISKIVYDLTKRSSFLGSDNRQITFDPESGYALSSLSIYNLRLMSKNSIVWNNVGIFSRQEGLFINVTKARAYNSSAVEVPLSQIKSVCGDSHCTQLAPESTAAQPSMAIQPFGGLTIGAVMPLHKSGSLHDMFDCGKLDEETFQNLLAFTYGLEMVNTNRSLLPDIQLGAIVFDDCSHKERAQERILSFLSSSDGNKISPKTLISMITYSDKTGQEIDEILDENKIIHLNANELQTTQKLSNYGSKYMRSPMKMSEINAIIDLITEYEWPLVNVIYSDENLKHFFVIQANKLKVCVDFMSAISEDMTVEEVKKDLNYMSDKSETKVIVVLGNLDINSLVLNAASDYMLKNFIWIGGQSWLSTINTSHPSLTPLTTFSMSIESYSDPKFATYLSTLSLHNHNSIPDNWLHQFWQQKFKCHLPHSPVIDTRFDDVCTGDERISAIDVFQSDYIHQTIGLVRGIANGIKNFLTERCHSLKQLRDIDDCPDSPREALKHYINEALNIKSDKQSKEGLNFGFHVMKRTNGQDFKNVGVWRDNVLDMKNKVNEFIQIKAHCVKHCDKCQQQFENSNQQLLHSEEMPPMVVTLRRTWGLVASILSALGVVSVLICVFYFLLVFPIAVGTTIIGYQILLGLFIAYSTNFVFLLPATFAICWLRRLGMSLSYAIIISGLLVKVLNTWRLMIIKNTTQQLRLSSPSALLFISSGFVLLQLILTIIWLFSFPPNPGLYDGLWKCSSAQSMIVFDSEIIVSLLYVVLLLLITIFFAALTWKCYDQNREPRWIMVCGLSTVAIWLFWLFFGGYSSDQSMSIVCANLLNSTLVMIILYVRKLYIFTKLSRQVRKERQLKSRLQHEPFAGQQQIYGALKSAAINPRIAWDSGQRQENTLRGATRAPFETDYEDNVSSCGSVKSAQSAQVQGHDLYPMEVYDGGSQFAPLSSLFSHSNKSVYGIMDDTTSFR